MHWNQVNCADLSSKRLFPKCSDEFTDGKIRRASSTLSAIDLVTDPKNLAISDRFGPVLSWVASVHSGSLAFYELQWLLLLVPSPPYPSKDPSREDRA
ncbi:Hypothetical protein NTJ_00820 [Nesidiocoris tenuis]|uniref:Uncharacterized protein n=1 Tax=Nesidiocoris tenuis TaxID=355587 RepID=A0ABN7A7R6_9HEMI|nr:Hypothetical protein NTJ_00820 [Nesidiocoris tenuis]